jgi:hypothetical protein
LVLVVRKLESHIANEGYPRLVLGKLALADSKFNPYTWYYISAYRLFSTKTPVNKMWLTFL